MSALTPPSSVGSPELQGNSSFSDDEEVPRGRKRRRSFERAQVPSMDPTKRRRTELTTLQPNLIYERTPSLDPTGLEVRSPTRSRSPPRLLLTRLKNATPTFTFEPSLARAQWPKTVLEMYRCLQIQRIEAGLQIIPEAFKELIPGMFVDDIPEHAFTTDQMPQTQWEAVSEILYEAKSCHDEIKDENAWVDLARLLLRTAGFSHRGNSIFQTNSIQTQNIDDDLLPVYSAMGLARQVPINKKTDLALAIVPLHGSADAILLKRALQAHGRLSQMLDVYTAKVPMVCGIEVKHAGGDANEAIAQLAIWSAAGLCHVKNLTAKSAIDVLPFLGWTVIGHEWGLYIIWLQSDTEVTCLGPVFRGWTSSYLGIFKILRMMERVDAYLEDVYWNWLKGVFVGQEKAAERATPRGELQTG